MIWNWEICYAIMRRYTYCNGTKRTFEVAGITSQVSTWAAPMSHVTLSFRWSLRALAPLLSLPTLTRRCKLLRLFWSTSWRHLWVRATQTIGSLFKSAGHAQHKQKLSVRKSAVPSIRPTRSKPQLTTATILNRDDRSYAHTIHICIGVLHYYITSKQR